MARKIDPTDEQRANLKKKNLERRNSLYSPPQSKFHINNNDLEEAGAPLSQVSDIISRFKNQKSSLKSAHLGFDSSFNEEKLNLLDNDTSSNTDTTPLNLSLLDNDTSSSNTTVKPSILMEPVSPNNTIDIATGNECGTSSIKSNDNSLFFNKITDLSNTPSIATHSLIETSNQTNTTNENATSIINEYSDIIIYPLQKFELINAIFLHGKELSNVEKNFLVCLILEMGYMSERMSLNQLIIKYDFRRATVYQVIPRISNLGFIKVITDNNPKGSIIDLSLLFEKYNIPTLHENDQSNLMSLVRNNNSLLTDFTNESDLNDNVSSKKLDTAKRIMIKNTILFLFKSMMILEAYRKIDHYNEKSIKLFTQYLLDKEVSQDSQIDLLGLALYSAEKAKNPERIVYYLHNTLENGGIESLQIAFKEKAKDYLDFSNQFFELDFEEPSLKEIREFSLKLQLDPNLSRSTLVLSMHNIRNYINDNILRLESIIDKLPEFKR